MEKVVVKVPAGDSFRDVPRETIRPLFEGTGIPGYFTIAMDIPPAMFDMEMPDKDYHFVFYEEKAPRAHLQQRKVHVPTVQQVLWAVGFANTELARVICKRPVRFAHQPFRAHKCPWKGGEPWRQIIVSRSKHGYSVETVSVTLHSPGSFWAYLHR